MSPKSLFNQSKLLQFCPILCRWGEAVKTLSDGWDVRCDQSASWVTLCNIFWSCLSLFCKLMNIYIVAVYMVYFETKDRLYHFHMMFGKHPLHSKFNNTEKCGDLFKRYQYCEIRCHYMSEIKRISYSLLSSFFI